jgi:hypothetical protein
MAKSVSSSISDQASSLRSLKRLVVLLVVSNLALGVFSVYLLRTVDRRYSELVDRSVPVLNDLQTLTALSANVMHRTGTVLLNAPAEKRAAMLRDARTALDQDRDLRNRLFKADWLSSRPEGKLEFKKAGDDFTQVASELLRQATGGQTAEAREFRERSLRPAFERYQSVTTLVADLLEAESQQTNLDYTARTNSLSNLVLGLAGWPLLVFVALLLLVVVLVIAMMVAFRGKDLADAP